MKKMTIGTWVKYEASGSNVVLFCTNGLFLLVPYTSTKVLPFSHAWTDKHEKNNEWFWRRNILLYGNRRNNFNDELSV